MFLGPPAISSLPSLSFRLICKECWDARMSISLSSRIPRMVFCQLTPSTHQYMIPDYPSSLEILRMNWCLTNRPQFIPMASEPSMLLMFLPPWFTRMIICTCHWSHRLFLRTKRVWSFSYLNENIEFDYNLTISFHDIQLASMVIKKNSSQPLPFYVYMSKLTYTFSILSEKEYKDVTWSAMIKEESSRLFSFMNNKNANQDIYVQLYIEFVFGWLLVPVNSIPSNSTVLWASLLSLHYSILRLEHSMSPYTIRNRINQSRVIVWIAYYSYCSSGIQGHRTSRILWCLLHLSIAYFNDGLFVWIQLLSIGSFTYLYSIRIWSTEQEHQASRLSIYISECE